MSKIKWLAGITITLFFFFQASLVFAEEAPNNKFGIHLAIPSEEDLQDAANLVNSSGGDWGYVTLVMEEGDLKREKWQAVFDRMRQLHLVPIIRLATSFENGHWRRPDTSDAPKWAIFLNSLNWVVKNRYLVLFNEPNRAEEWGGQVDPESYASLSYEFAKTLKEKNQDFFVMLAGFDAAAPTQLPNYMDEVDFLKGMRRFLKSEEKEIFDYLSGWASHSYPNHGFVGSPYSGGRNSVKNYLWERSLLKSLGVSKNLPVFITETGWPHKEGKTYQRGFYSEDEVAENFRIYFNRLTDSPEVIAATPFILNYQDLPFDHFSWRKLNHQRQFYPQYGVAQGLPKVKGEPKQEQKLEISSWLPSKLITGSTYQIPVTVENKGQAIWSQKEGYKLKLVGSGKEFFEHFFSDFNELKPFEKETLWLYLKTGEKLGPFTLDLVVTKDDKPLSNAYSWSLEIIPAVDINFRVSLFPKRKTQGDDFKLIIYNSLEEVVFEKEGVMVKDGLGKVEKVKNLAIGERYRLVILKPYYLPRQGFLVIEDKTNQITFERMLPLDFNQDGKFSLGDFWALLKNPKLFQSLWLY